MSRLKNENWEIFCQHYVATGVQTEAAIAAGYKVPHVAASKMMKNEQIKERILELQKVGDRNRKKLKKKITEKLIEIMDNSEKNFEVLKAIEILNKMFGFNEETNDENTVNNTQININLIPEKPKQEMKIENES